MERRASGEGAEREREKEERKERQRGRKKEGERVLRGKGKDVGLLKEDATRRSQLSHRVVNP